MRLDGRDFDGLTQALTARQNDYITVNLRLSGATESLGAFEKTDDDATRATKATDCVNRILESGRKYKILAGILTEQGKKWTREEADRNAERFADITDVEDQRVMNGELLNLVIGFFKFAGASSATSQTFSSPSNEAPASSNEAQPILATTAP